MEERVGLMYRSGLSTAEARAARTADGWEVPPVELLRGEVEQLASSAAGEEDRTSRTIVLAGGGTRGRVGVGGVDWAGSAGVVVGGRTSSKGRRF